MLTRTASATVESSTEASISEPTIVEPVFVSGIAQAKVIGGLLYMALFVEQPGIGKTTARGSSKLALSCRFRP